MILFRQSPRTTALRQGPARYASQKRTPPTLALLNKVSTIIRTYRNAVYSEEIATMSRSLTEARAGLFCDCEC